MKAITIAQPGGPEALVLAEVPAPEPAAGEVRIRVSAAGVNRADIMQRNSVHRVLVVNDGNLLGIVTTMDITTAVADNLLRDRGLSD